MSTGNNENLNKPATPWEWQSIDSLKDLTRAVMVRNKSNPGKTYIVTANYGDRVTAVDTVDITNPEEWEILR
jgi:spermidine/putrescine-binding protein